MVDSGNSYGERVSRLVGWGHWFAFFNIIAAMLVGTRYITQSPWPETLLGQSYLAFSWVGHFGFLVFALYLLILFPLTFAIPSRKLFRLIAVCFATVGLTVLLVDTQAYQSINLHLTPVVWELLFTDDKSAVSSELQHLFIVLPLIFLLELGLSEWVWRKQRKLSHKHIGRPLAAVFFLSFMASHVVYIWADAYFYGPITSQKANFPLSYPMTAKSFMEKHGLLDRDEYLKRLEQNENNVDLVRYPLETIKFNRRGENLNVLIVSVNNLRADMLNAETMPNSYQFAQDNLNFTNHYSSSNDMYGMFGLFYGLPSSYASSIKAQGTSPILLSVLEDQGYSTGLFSGDNFDDTLYSEVIFRSQQLANQQENSDNEPHSDSSAINNWDIWVKNQASSPWFSFIELTTVDNFSDYGDHTDTLEASDRFQIDYAKSAQAADIELSKLYSSLNDLELLQNTIVVITSNHGSEFNETQTNSWGSNGNYSRYQLQVPMVIHWPGKLAAQFTHQSSHLDFSVTLLQDLLGVSSNPNDFSSGKSLFDENKRKWILAGDSRELALITNNKTTVIDKFGNYKLYDSNYNRLKDQNPKLPVLMQGLTELQRFYTKSK
ncbi:DUF3413 domain-containing protein [Vibrio genomosp. F6]|uniref:DUF3413 domain-containing protein n=1 Tax=Vibrio genomosp. F6 TaxID=723172 RepID=UPI0010BE1870|nr:DUF3413 domain-containing protein [Vibrio genomosp. F6]TKF22554.1 DUF3413 domain-containing protein [Vibrio genomosp. F6]